MVKAAINIVDVVRGYLPLSPAGGTAFKGVCPFHQDSRPSLQVDEKWQNFRCWACGKFGDVFTFTQEMEKVGFREAITLLARRANIDVDDAGVSDRHRLIEAVRWAAEHYQQCLLDHPIAEDARRYLGSRKLTGETVRKFGLGFAPPPGDWLVERAGRSSHTLDTLVEVGLIGRRERGAGSYDRFRDRVMFPIRDVRGQPVGFGGRLLPGSPLSDRAPKYYNSAETPLFSKSELLYGLDLARHHAPAAGHLAVVEGYTDVMMAHQCGVGQCVATMGTALNARHVQQLRRFAPRVLLVYDADAGGNTGVDRALEIFLTYDVELLVATLPEGLDPCDLLVRDGADAFRAALAGAVDALDFKLKQVMDRESGSGTAGQRRAVDAVLGVLSLTPEIPGQGGQVKRELIVTRIARRLGLREETVWARLGEMREARRQKDREAAPERRAGSAASVKRPNHGPAAPEERELLEVLLAEPAYVDEARKCIGINDVRHPDVRQLLSGLYELREAGEPANLDGLRARLDSHLARAALALYEVGRKNPQREAWFKQILTAFTARRERADKRELHGRLNAADDHETALELLRRWQNPTGGSDR